MSSIVRVKRRIDEEPLDALVLQTKRKKLDKAADKQEPVFRFCGTLTSKEKEITSVKELLEKSKTAISEQRRDVKKQSRKTAADRFEERKKELSENRYRLVNQFRNVPLEGSDLQIYDLVPETEQAEDVFTVNGVPMVVETISKAMDEDGFVYDIYLSQTTKFDKSYLDRLLYVQPYNQEFFFENDSESDKELYDEDEDSNDEDNWRNEYPDTDEDGEGFDDYGMSSKFDSWHLGESDEEDPYEAYKRRLDEEEAESSD